MFGAKTLIKYIWHPQLTINLFATLCYLLLLLGIFKAYVERQWEWEKRVKVVDPSRSGSLYWVSAVEFIVLYYFVLSCSIFCNTLLLSVYFSAFATVNFSFLVWFRLIFRGFLWAVRVALIYYEFHWVRNSVWNVRLVVFCRVGFLVYGMNLSFLGKMMD